MAKIGLNNFRYAKLTEAQDGTPSYDGAKKPAKAISCSVSITNNEVTLYADDVLAESDTSFQSGDVTIGIDDEDQSTLAVLLGHDVDANGVMVRNSQDVAPYVGLGRIIVKMVGGVYKYKVEFLNKVKFAEPSQDDNTKGESIEFGTTQLVGKVSTLANGDWSATKTFDSKDDAITFLEGLMASESPSTYNVTNNLVHCSTSNGASLVASGDPYTATITAQADYVLGTVTVTMGGTDISATAVDENVISIASVSGNVVVSASASTN